MLFFPLLLWKTVFPKFVNFWPGASYKPGCVQKTSFSAPRVNKLITLEFITDSFRLEDILTWIVCAKKNFFRDLSKDVSDKKQFLLYVLTSWFLNINAHGGGSLGAPISEWWCWVPAVLREAMCFGDIIWPGAEMRGTGRTDTVLSLLRLQGAVRGRVLDPSV